jgi:hypothetical protein
LFEQSDQAPVSNWQKKQTTPLNGKKKHGKKQKQQTKTTKHTIEFSNNTPGYRQPCYCTRHRQRRQTTSASPRLGPWASGNTTPSHTGVPNRGR